jgi:lipopolysaccharide transport system permease protein
VRLAVPLATQLFLFVTPVLYPLSSAPTELRTVLLINPMTGIVDSFRHVLAFGRSPDPATLIPALIGSLVALALGLWYFSATNDRFADVV